MDGVQQHRPRLAAKRRRFRNPACLAALALALLVSVVYLFANLLWTAAAGRDAPSLLGLVCDITQA